VTYSECTIKISAQKGEYMAPHAGEFIGYYRPDALTGHPEKIFEPVPGTTHATGDTKSPEARFAHSLMSFGFKEVADEYGPICDAGHMDDSHDEEVGQDDMWPDIRTQFQLWFKG